MKRNLTKTDEKTETYLGNKIIAWFYRWEEYNNKKNTWESYKEVYCHLYRPCSDNQPLILGQCNDGSKFTAVNQAKEFVNICNSNNW